MKTKKSKSLYALIPLGLLATFMTALLTAALCFLDIIPSGGGIAAAASPPVITGALEAWHLWVIAGSASAVLVTAVIVVLFLAFGRHKKIKSAAQKAAAAEYGSEIYFAGAGIESAATQLDFFANNGDEFIPLPFEPDGGDGEAAAEVPDAPYTDGESEEDAPEESEESEEPFSGQISFDDAAQLAESAPLTYNRGLLSKFIRDVNVKAAEYKRAHTETAEHATRRNKLKAHAASLQSKIFKANSLELITHCSATLNKIYKHIALSEKLIADGKKEKAKFFSQLKEARIVCNNYISDNRIQLSDITAAEDEVLFDIALESKMKENDFAGEILAARESLEKSIEEKKREIAALEAELIYWEQNIGSAGDDEKLEGALKLIDIQEALDACHDGLAPLLYRLSNYSEDGKADEITQQIRQNIESGSGLVTREQKKLISRASK